MTDRGAQPGTEAGRALIADLMSSAKRMGPWQVADAILAIEAEARQQGRETLDVMAVLDRELDRQRELARRGGGEPIDWLFANGFATAVEVARAALAADPRAEP